MRASQRLVDICWALYNKHKDLAHGNDNQRRELTMMICEQAKFEFTPANQDYGYGTKSSTETNPPSKDSIAYNDVNVLWSIDWQNGTSREPQIVEGSEFENITGQHFITVDAVNHLGSNEPIPVPPADPTNPPNDTEVVKLLKDIQLRQMRMEQDIDTIYETINKWEDEGMKVNLEGSDFPDYKGNARFIGEIKLTPVKKNETR
jgi:hypothetical protein